jgi:preprotein translocase subunit SecD
VSLRLGAFGLAVLIVFAPACSGGSGSEGVEITLRSVDPVQDSELDRSVAILEERLDQAGIEARVTAEDDSRHVVIRLDRSRSAAVERVVELSTTTGLLEVYDLEASLLYPSIDAGGSAVATSSLYNLLVGRQPAREDDVESWYLFDPEKKRTAGPTPTKQLLLRGFALRDGWRILGVPPGSVVLECGIGEHVCPGLLVEHPQRDSYYLVRFDPPRAPELDVGDLQLEETRQDADTTTGSPVVLLRFTDAGADEFSVLTDRLADRGRTRLDLSGGGDPFATYQHLAIVLDREIKSWPSIDWQAYPNGIAGENGVQINGIGNLQEARDIALVLRTGALPVRFEFLARRETGG